MTRRHALIGIDPGFAYVGVAILELEAKAKPRIVHLGVLRTAPERGPRKVYVVDDNLRRALEIAKYLRGLATMTQASGAVLAGFCVEAMGYPRNAANAAKVSMCWGILAALSEATSVPIIQTTAMQVKTAVAGVRTASKDDVQAAMLAEYPEIAVLRARLRRMDWEHAHDALAVAHVLLDSEAIAFARRAP